MFFTLYMMEAPAIPALDLTFRVYAYWRTDGWVSVAVDYVDDCDEAPCGSRFRLYIPSSRFNIRSPKAHREWVKRSQIEPIFNIVEEYVNDVGRIFSFVASRAGPKARKALERFPVRIWVANSGVVRKLGLVVGRKVVALGPPPRRLYYYRGMRGWRIPRDVYDEVFTMAWTYYWRAVVERVAKCKVETVGGGDAKVVCRGNEFYARQVLPI